VDHGTAYLTGIFDLRDQKLIVLYLIGKLSDFAGITRNAAADLLDGR